MSTSLTGYVWNRPHVFVAPALGQLAGQSTIVAICVVGAMFLLIIGVVFPAVWSRKSARRKAAVEVIDRLLRRRR